MYDFNLVRMFNKNGSPICWFDVFSAVFGYGGLIVLIIFPAIFLFSPIKDQAKASVIEDKQIESFTLFKNGYESGRLKMCLDLTDNRGIVVDNKCYKRNDNDQFIPLVIHD